MKSASVKSTVEPECASPGRVEEPTQSFYRLISPARREDDTASYGTCNHGLHVSSEPFYGTGDRVTKRPTVNEQREHAFYLTRAGNLCGTDNLTHDLTTPLGGRYGGAARVGRTVGQRREFAAKWALDSRLYGNGSTRGWLVLIALMSTSIGAQPRDRSPRAKWRRIERAKWRRCAHELSEGVAHGTFA